MKVLDIKAIRAKYKITQQELSEKTGYQQGFISQMENWNEATPQGFIDLVALKFNIKDIDLYIKNVESERRVRPNRIIQSAVGKNARNGTSSKAVEKLLTLLEKKDEKIEELRDIIDQLRDKIDKYRDELDHYKDLYYRSNNEK